MLATGWRRAAMGAGVATLALGACRDKAPAPPPVIVVARHAHGTALDDPDARFWRNTPEYRIPIMPQNIAKPMHMQPAVTEVRVRAAHDGDMIAVRLDWADDSESLETAADRFGDQVAIQFPAGLGAPPSPTMGHPGGAVEILQWRAVLQREVTHGPPQITDLYPNATYDVYPDVVLEGEKLAPYTGGRAANNPVSQPRLLSPVVSHFAEGFGTLTAAPAQIARGRGVWRDGRWHVVVTRRFASGGEHGPAGMRPGTRTVIGFAVWEGGNKEVGSRKGWAPWIQFQIAE
jgi:DMSO reductase family type II enzyme heme b subunit